MQIEMWRPAGFPALRARELATGVVAAALLFPLSAAIAETVNVADQDIVLTAPKGSCALDNAEPSDRGIIAMLEARHAGKNSVLMVFGDCKTITRARRGQGTAMIDGQILAPYDGATPRVYDAQSRAQALQEVAAAIPKLPWQQIARATEMQWKSEGQTLPRDSLKPLGVLHSDADGVYFGILMSAPGPDGKLQNVAGIVGVALVNKVLLSINLYRAYAGQATIDALLKEQRQNIRALIQANEAPPRGAGSNAMTVSGVDWREIAISSAIGGAIFAGLLCLYVAFQRVRDAINS